MSVTGHIIGNWNLSGEVNDSGGTNVVPNPPEEATDTLEKVGIDDVVYSITGEQEQADWDQADPTAVDYIKNKPTIPAAQVNSDWDAASGVAQILNKPTLSTVATSGSYTDLTDTPTIPAAQVNSDWDAVSGVAQILNKPTIPAAQVNSDWNAVSGVAEILNKPTIPAAQVNSDWDAASGVAEILNKPTLSTVATSGEASDVSYDNTLSGMTATDVQDAVDELKSNLTDLKTWKFLDAKIGNTAIQLPQVWNELLVYCRFGNSSGVLQPQITTTVIANDTESYSRSITSGGGTLFSQVQLLSATNTISMVYFGVSGTDCTSTSQIRVFYR